jgi:hypothetical protein
MNCGKFRSSGGSKMVAKKIELSPNLKFASIAAGKTYFGAMLERVPVGQRVTKEEFDALKLLYEAYCAKTNYPMPSPPKAFFPKYEQQKGYTTKCFGVEFEDGSSNRFSLDKALTAVAKA